MTENRTNTRTVGKLFVTAIAMFGFGYALVPMYDVFCEVTGFNGKTGAITVEQASTLNANPNRLVTVEFDTNINGELPWVFKSVTPSVQVHPGKMTDVMFVVENTSDRPIVGQAIPSVAPGQASIYFNKTECFCFTQQTLAPHERKEMLVRFVVDSGLPERISTLTLSYTFFMAPEAAQIAAKTQAVSINRSQTKI